MPEGDFSDELVRLWRLPSGSGLGRPAALDVDGVVRAAVELADRSGLSGATLPKIADKLGVTPMSLYRYVGSKDELFVLMGDSALPPDAELAAVGGEWRNGLRAWASALWSGYKRHPWLPDLPVSGPPRGPNAIAWMDAGLRAMRDTGFEAPAKVGILTMVSGYVRYMAGMAQQLAQGRSRDGVDQIQSVRDYGRDMSRLIERSRFPDAAELFSSAVFEIPDVSETDAPADPDFTFGLELILDGIAVAVARDSERQQVLSPD